MRPGQESSGTPAAFKIIGITLFLCFGFLYYMADQQETKDISAGLSREKLLEMVTYQVEEEQIIAGTTTELKGVIRNIGSQQMSGFVKIRVFNFSGELIGTFKTSLNDQKPVAPGETGTFSYHVASHKVTDAAKLQVSFQSW